MTHPTHSPELVEAVARGLYESEHTSLKNVWSWDDSGLDDEHPSSRKYFLRIAQAALTAAEPFIAARVEAAVLAEREAILQSLPGGTHCDPQEIADAIRARGGVR